MICTKITTSATGWVRATDMTVPATAGIEEAGDGTPAGGACTTVTTAMIGRGMQGGRVEGGGGAGVVPPVLREVVDGATIWGGVEILMRIPVYSVADLLLTYFFAYLVSLVSSIAEAAERNE